MGFLRNEMTKSVTTLIEEFGQFMTLTRFSVGSYNSVTGVVTNTPDSSTVRAVIVGFRKEDIDGDAILRGDRKAYVQLDGADVPEPGDKITGLDTDVAIVAVHKILRNATGSIVCICQARS